LLETLARAPFPIDPVLEHDKLRELSLVRFPVVFTELELLREVLLTGGFGLSILSVAEDPEASGPGELALDGALD
jgi:hypothetical protein